MRPREEPTLADPLVSRGVLPAICADPPFRGFPMDSHLTLVYPTASNLYTPFENFLFSVWDTHAEQQPAKAAREGGGAHSETVLHLREDGREPRGVVPDGGRGAFARDCGEARQGRAVDRARPLTLAPRLSRGCPRAGLALPSRSRQCPSTGSSPTRSKSSVSRVTIASQPPTFAMAATRRSPSELGLPTL